MSPSLVVKIAGIMWLRLEARKEIEQDDIVQAAVLKDELNKSLPKVFVPDVPISNRRDISSVIRSKYFFKTACVKKKKLWGKTFFSTLPVV